AACNPDALIPAGVVLAGADDIITTRGTVDPYDAEPSDTNSSNGDEAYEPRWPDTDAADGDSDELWWAR
ncbi:MAG: hypothetical protein ABI418_02285, partial [Jatrophihabitantaceae bacterium]